MDEPTRLATQFQALADPSRLRLIQFIAGGEPTATECVQRLGQSQPRVARHLRILVESGVLVARRDGRFVHYSLAGAGVGEILARAAVAALGARPAPASSRGVVAAAQGFLAQGSLPQSPLAQAAAVRGTGAGSPGGATPDRTVAAADLPPDRPPLEDFLL